MTLDQDIAFIGAGNMASALIRGLIDGGTARPEQLVAYDIRSEASAELAAAHGVRAAASLEEAARCPVVVLSVKPQTFTTLLPELAGLLPAQSLIISVAAGVPLSAIEAALGQGRRAIRVMPNTPALVQAGAAGIAAGSHTNDEDLAIAEAIFNSVGSCARVPETLIDAVTGLSGSGPAYVFLLIEALQAAGQQQGLPAQTAAKLAAQTVYGAAKLLLDTGEPVAELRRKVTSPGGTTAAGLASLGEAGFEDIIKAAVTAATQRAEELGAQTSAGLTKD